MNTKGIIISLILVSLVSFQLVLAADVAYLYKIDTRIDKNIVKAFSDKGLSVDFINENILPVDFSNYRIIFVGDESFTKDIPVTKFNSIIFNYYIGAKSGITDRDGISRIVSRELLGIYLNGSIVKIYTSSRDSYGNLLPAYYLDDGNKALSLDKFLGTYSTGSGSDFGDIISFGEVGDRLANGQTLESNICFFGIVKSDYWTNESKNFFNECINEVYPINNNATENNTDNNIQCNVNSDCGTNLENLICINNSVYLNYTEFLCIPDTLGCSKNSGINFVETCNDFCSNGACRNYTCKTDSDCDDGDMDTIDNCIISGVDSNCSYLTLSPISIGSFEGIPDIYQISLNFSSSYDEKAKLIGYKVSNDDINWIDVILPESKYVFSGLSPSTSYTFFVKSFDNLSRYSDEKNITVSTLSLPVVYPGGGGGSSSLCMTQWVCGDWSECLDGNQTRTCDYPENYCTPYIKKPSEIQGCVVPKTEIKNNPVIKNETAPSKPEVNIPNELAPITGGAIGTLGKSIIGVIIFFIIILGLYLYVKFAKK